MNMKEYLRLQNVALSPSDWRGMIDYIPPMNRAERRRAKRRGKKKNTRGQLSPVWSDEMRKPVDKRIRTVE